MYPSEFDYFAPDTLDEALALLAEHGDDAKILAGGQSLVPLLNFRLVRPARLIDLNRVAGLDGMENGCIRAMTRSRTIERESELPLLRRAVRFSGHAQIRNRGTVGGSCAHADPASELPGIAQTCDAEITVIGKAGTRTIKAAAFFQGALTTALDPDEIITEVHLPAWPAGRRYGFQEFARRRGDFAMAGVALYYDTDGGKAANGHIGVFGVGD